MERSEKIKLLKGIEAGNIRVKQLQPILFVSLRRYANKPGVLYNEQGRQMLKNEANSYIKGSTRDEVRNYSELNGSNHYSELNT